ncbi:MAG: SpoIID/LytB domain-containing protein [Synergistaceae bacterium]|nr:SpoIID/LytB domain-containing protein [Synergistaceae bacterium]
MEMIKIKTKIFVMILAVLTWPFEAQARDVYVRLANSNSYSVSTTQGMMAMTDAEGRLANIGETAEISASNGYVTIMGNQFPMPVRITSSGFLQFKGRTYRGTFLITQRAGLLNVIDVEEYLCGVLPAEVGANWHSEALRTQAICARTYVLKQSMNRADKGYDVVDTDADQVYKGAGAETPKTNQAVASTIGEVLTYGNELAFTYFHSDSGGHTADISDVWGQQLPYLKGVPEIVNYKSPVSVWNAKVSAQKIQNAVKKVTGTDIGAVSEVQVSEVDDGGRAINMRFIGSNGTQTMRASQFRTAISPREIKSTMFTPSGGSFNANDTATPSGLVAERKSQGSPNDLTFEESQGIARMTSEGIFTTTELVDMLTNPDKRKQYYEVGLKRGGGKSSAPSKPKNKYGYSIERAGSDFIFYGRGWGHGVGMSQWGAMAMAEKGYTAEKILAHYYPGTSVRKIK